MENALQLHVHVIMRHDADVVFQELSEEGSDGFLGRVEEGGLGFGEGPLRVQPVVVAERKKNKSVCFGKRKKNKKNLKASPAEPIETRQSRLRQFTHFCAFKVEWMTMEGNTSTCCAGGADTLEKYVLGIAVGVAVVARLLRLLSSMGGEWSSWSRRRDAIEGEEQDAVVDNDRARVEVDLPRTAAAPAEDVVSRRAARRSIMVDRVGTCCGFLRLEGRQMLLVYGISCWRGRQQAMQDLQQCMTRFILEGGWEPRSTRHSHYFLYMIIIIIVVVFV